MSKYVFPRQVDREIGMEYKSIRDYGCLLMVYSWFVYMKTGYEFSVREILCAYDMAVSRGFILNNALPTDGSKGKWYRCWIKDPSAWMRLLASSVKREVSPQMLFKVEKLEGKTAPYYCVENFIKTAFLSGVHFTARLDPSVDAYNPGALQGLKGIKTIRGWSL